MKKLLGLICFAVLFMAANCENEPLEGEFLTEAEVACLQAIDASAEAQANFDVASTEDAPALCSMLKTALEAQIASCGDDNGFLQARIDSLGDCSIQIDEEACAMARAEKDTAEIAFNDSTDENYTETCNALKEALEAVLQQCGPDQAIQDQIDSLGNCLLSSEPVLIKQIIFTEPSGESYTNDFSYEGNRLTSITSSDGGITEYIYEAEVMQRIENRGANGEIFDYTELEYNAENQLSAYSTIIPDANQGYRTELTYNIDGTITQETFIGDADTQTEVLGTRVSTLVNGQITEETAPDGSFIASYSYDSSNGIYKNIFKIEQLHLINFDFSQLLGGAQNNITEFTQDDGSGGTEMELFTYTYNSANYPETGQLFYDGVLNVDIQFFYE
ncbi:hypothetical protein Q2T40_11805 [Winogradskyella maritima]|uniref:YD repeat-containing protein n=1 Tax=Winogradskyella maritima TaxID=1517766 RepID=A0ABV8AII2_9FLAO|nr:hypothetical protein [Winogradskyella maritima]